MKADLFRVLNDSLELLNGLLETSQNTLTGGRSGGGWWAGLELLRESLERGSDALRVASHCLHGKQTLKQV